MFRREERSALSSVESADSASNFFERLEARRLMSASLPNYANFVHTSGLAFNGYDGNAVTIKHALQLTDGNPTEARSAWYTNLVNVGSFSTTFSFATTKNNVSADGFSFTLQRIGTNALGYNGHDLGYAGIKDSVSVDFNLYNYSAYGSMFGFASKGKVPTTATSMGNVNLHDGDVFTCTITYDGATLSAKVVDTGHPSDVFSDSEAINIPSTIGGTTAYVGFTGATGVQYSTQETTDSTADDTTVTVFSDGDYTFQVTVKDKNGYTATDDVTIDRT
jgi:hypothetical protein